ncbi:MAG: hypothetical protein ACLQMO_01950 [Acidobacteriaceae bacterium]
MKTAGPHFGRVAEATTLRSGGQRILAYTGNMPRRNGLWGILLLASLAAVAAIAGCRAALVETRVVNSGTTVLHNIEVDYPSASFGISNLAPGATYIYRIQLQDAGRMKVEFSDSKEQPHSGKGPYVAQGQQGTLTLTLDGSGKNEWVTRLHPAVTAPAGE